MLFILTIVHMIWLDFELCFDIEKYIFENKKLLDIIRLYEKYYLFKNLKSKNFEKKSVLFVLMF